MPTAFQRPAAALRRRSLPWLLALLLALSPLLPLPAQAQPVLGAGHAGTANPWVAEVELGVGLQLSASAPSVRQPNGEYRETHIDLRVNALGGPIDIARSWSQGRWWLNPAWAPLNFELDPLDGSARVIERAGLIYERSGSSELFNYSSPKPTQLRARLHPQDLQQTPQQPA
ncbi:hypothetical protein AAHN93_00175 [Vandammella animalimorsus]|uniref:hypothetical protein n=1 Tax=Vandammella animalimorsus TaxID=2029117 RepID=UPI0031BA5976